MTLPLGPDAPGNLAPTREDSSTFTEMMEEDTRSELANMVRGLDSGDANDVLLEMTKIPNVTVRRILQDVLTRATKKKMDNHPGSDVPASSNREGKSAQDAPAKTEGGAVNSLGIRNCHEVKLNTTDMHGSSQATLIARIRDFSHVTINVRADDGSKATRKPDIEPCCIL
jgi:hypothetical protein